MEKQVYQNIERSESGWWYKGRCYALQAIVPRFVKKPGSVLDMGAGYGAMQPFLAQLGTTVAYEIYPEAIAACRTRGYAEVIDSSEVLAKRTNEFSVVAAFDALEHMEDDARTVREIASLLATDGFFIGTVPAHPFLFGQYDIDAHHFRRYTKKALRAVLEGNGFDVRYLGYWNGLLFLPAALARVLGIATTAALSPHPLIDRLFTFCTYLEALYLRIGKLPTGLSLVVVAQKR
jgi:SAM-dependent methyltransferase